MGTLSLPDELTRKLEALAQADGITMEEYVRKVLDTDVLKNRKKIKRNMEDPLRKDREVTKNPLKKPLETEEVNRAFATYMQSFAVTLQPYSSAKFRVLFGRVEFAYAKNIPDQPDDAVTRESLLQSSLVEVIGIPTIAAENEPAWLLPLVKDLSPLILKHAPDILPAIVAAKSCAQIIGEMKNRAVFTLSELLSVIKRATEGEAMRMSWDDREDIFTTTVLSVIRDLGLNTEGIHYQVACQIRTSIILCLPSQKTVERTDLQTALQTMIRRKMLKEGTIKKLTQRKTGETPHEEMSWVNARCVSEDEIIASIDTASYEALDIPAENKRSIVVQCVRATLQKHGFELRKVTFADLKHAIEEYLRNPSSMENQPPDYRTALDSQGQRTPRQKTGSAKTFS